MKRKLLVLPAAMVALISIGFGQADEQNLTEQDVLSMQKHMQEGTLTSQEIVRFYLSEIERIDRAGPELRSVIETNPEALAIAKALDDERAETGSRGGC